MKKTFINYMFGGYYQVSFVTKDREKGMKFFQETMGVPKFKTIDKPEGRNLTYRGKPANIETNIAFGQMGDTSIELIQPLNDDSTYHELLKNYDWIGLHHMAVKVFDHEKAVKDLTDQGLVVAQSGEMGDGSKYAYMDTVAQYGHFLEILYYDLKYEKMFDGIKRGDF